MLLRSGLVIPLLKDRVCFAGDSSVELVAIKAGGEPVPESNYVRSDKGLTISGLPSGSFELEIHVHIKPQVTTALL